MNANRYAPFAAPAMAPVAPFAEGDVKAKDVPPLLVTDAGKPMSDSKGWESERRGELKKWFLENEYGILPAAAKVPDVIFEDAAPPRPAFGGIATEHRVKASCRGPYGVFAFEFTAYVPVKNVPSPAFLLIATRDIHNGDEDLAAFQKSGYWPAEDIVRRGYAAVAFINYDVAADTYTSATALGSGVFAAYEKPSERTPKSWGALRAWAWGASRVMDWIEGEPAIDASRVAVVGHSRGGKAALVAGVTDARFAMVCSNCSGTGGARIMHINLPKSEPWTSWAHFGVQYWFAPAATEPGISWEKHDQHQFLALIAPRLLCVRSKTLDDWAGPDGERECVRFAKPAWDLYGAGDNIGYALAKGRHSLDARDWSRYMDFADNRMTTAYAESMRGAFAAESGAGDFDPRDYGAKGDGCTFDTAAVQRAIDECAGAGGGRVVVDGGTYLVKPIRLRSGVELHLASGGRILGSGDWRDYPNRGDMRHVVSENLPRARDAALIWADEAERISITGEGVIDGNGMCFVRPVADAESKKWKFERIGGFEQSPPRVVFFAGCRDVTVKGVLLTNQPAGWGYWVHDCDRVVFDGCRIRSDVTYPNNDGIHINACRDVTISNCVIESGDDAIVVRCNTRSLAERKTCERVTVRNCDLRSYANCIRVGWCREGTIRDCSFSDIVCHDSTVGINIWFVPKSWNPAGDYGIEKTVIERISFSNIAMERMHTTPLAVRVFEGAEDDIAACRGISFSNVVARAYGFPYFDGAKDRPFEGFSFSDCRFARDSSAAGPWRGADKTPPQEFILRNCRGFTFDRTTFDDWAANRHNAE